MLNKILITGSSKGVGKEVARIFHENNWHVCLTSRDLLELQKVKKELKQGDSQILDFEVDFTKKDQVLALNQYLKKEWGDLDSIILNVGSGSGEKNITSTYQDNERIFYKNFYAAINTVELLKDLLIKSKNPIIIFIGSIAALKNVKSPINYAMAKKSIENYAKSMSIKYADLGVRVNCVHLGHVLTQGGIWEKKLKQDPINLKKFIDENTLTKEIVTPESVAEFIYSLHSESYSKFMSGSNILFDAGTSLV